MKKEPTGEGKLCLLIYLPSGGTVPRGIKFMCSTGVLYIGYILVWSTSVFYMECASVNFA